MLITNTENIRRWIEQSDIDYISHYIKAWIPFNAWYNASYPDSNTDREKISKIKNEPNTIRNKINSLMENSGQESQEFKSFLSSLYRELENTQIDGRDGRIWFQNIVKERNSVNQINDKHNRIHYFLRVNENEVKINLNRCANNSSLFRYNHTEYNLIHLKSNVYFLRLSKAQQQQIEYYFKQLEPFLIKPIIQIEHSEEPQNYYKCDNIYFVRDTGNSNCYSITIAKALIEILYQLRNILFHGQLVPNKESQKVYKNAYFCLKYLLESLK